MKKEVGDSTYKGGHNDLRKTTYDVQLDENGKLDLNTHKTIMTESSNVKESVSAIVKTARELQSAINKTSHNPSSMNLQFKVGNKTYNSAYVLEDEMGNLVIKVK